MTFIAITQSDNVSWVTRIAGPRKFSYAVVLSILVLMIAPVAFAQTGTVSTGVPRRIAFYAVETGEAKESLGYALQMAIVALERSIAVRDPMAGLTVERGEFPESFLRTAADRGFSMVLVGEILRDNRRGMLSISSHGGSETSGGRFVPGPAIRIPEEDFASDLDAAGDAVVRAVFPDWVGFGSIRLVPGDPRTEPFDSWSLFGIPLALDQEALSVRSVFDQPVRFLLDGVAADSADYRIALVPSGERYVEVSIGSGGVAQVLFEGPVAVAPNAVTDLTFRPPILPPEKEAQLAEFVTGEFPNAAYSFVQELLPDFPELESLIPALELAIYMERAREVSDRVRSMWRAPSEVDPLTIDDASRPLELRAALAGATAVPEAVHRMIDELVRVRTSYPQLVALDLIRSRPDEMGPGSWRRFVERYEEQVSAAAGSGDPPAWLRHDVDAMRGFVAEHDRTYNDDARLHRILVGAGAVLLGTGIPLWGTGMSQLQRLDDLYRDYEAARNPGEFEGLRDEIDQAERRSLALQGSGITLGAVGAASIASGIIVRHQRTVAPGRLLDTRMNAYLSPRLQLDEELTVAYPGGPRPVPVDHLPLWRESGQ